MCYQIVGFTFGILHIVYVLSVDNGQHVDVNNRQKCLMAIFGQKFNINLDLINIY